MANFIVKEIFKNKKVNFNKLAGFGFIKHKDNFVYKTHIMDNQFLLFITIDKSGEVNTKLIDIATEDEYTLFLMPGATGAFVGAVKAEYEQVLTSLANSCFEDDIFKSNQAKKVIEYAKNAYGDELEFLWKDSPNTAIIRRKETSKWYILLFCEKKNKLGVECDKMVEILNLHLPKEEVEKLIDFKKYYPAYHMNKKSWISLCLDNTIDIEEIKQKIDTSYLLAKK